MRIKNKDDAPVIWITGLSGSGKSTLARALKMKLDIEMIPSVILDGDELRNIFKFDKSSEDYNRSNRLLLSKKYSKLSKIISSQGVIVIIATISLFKEIHDWNRENISSYFEVYLKVPMEVLKKRDAKKIYQNESDSINKNVVGIDIKYDEPINPDFTTDYRDNVNNLSSNLINSLKKKGFI